MLDDSVPPRPPRAPTSDPEPLWLGHPRGLAILFGAELWERFSYYGMRALLVLYAIDALGRSEAEAYALYAAYGAIVYAFGVVGGWVAQRWVGSLRAIVLGGALMALGHLVMALPWADGLYWALALLCVGNGLFKPNVSSRVGALYDDEDPRKAQGFYVFYMGINVGAMLAPAVCSTVAAWLGWHYGFGLAGAGMIVGLAILVRGRRLLRPRTAATPSSAAPSSAAPSAPAEPSPRAPALAFALAAMTLASAALLSRPAWAQLAVELVGLGVVAILVTMAVQASGAARRKLLALLVLMAFHTAFWAAFEQIGSSLVVLAEQHVDRTLLGVRIPAAAILALNGALVLLLAPVISGAWIRLARRGAEPSTPAKFGLGLALLGTGFLVLSLGVEAGIADGRVALGWVALFYVLMTLGELCLSPVGLAMVTELAPKRATGLCMGAWFLTYAAGHLVAGWIAGATAGPAGEATAASLLRYVEVFTWLGLCVLALGVILVLVRRSVQRLVAGQGA